MDRKSETADHRAGHHPCCSMWGVPAAECNSCRMLRANDANQTAEDADPWMGWISWQKGAWGEMRDAGNAIEDGRPDLAIAHIENALTILHRAMNKGVADAG